MSVIPNLEVPSGLDTARLVEILNDRMRTIQAALETPTQAGPLDLAQNKIVNLTDPTAPQDGLNLRTADRRYAPSGAVGSIQQALKPQATAAPVSGGAANASVLQVSLTTSTTAIASGIGSPTTGQILAVEVAQDGTGGRLITWASEFHTDTPTDINPAPSKLTRFLFAYYGGKFRCHSYFAEPLP